VAVAGLIMHLRLVSGRGGSRLAEYYTRDLEKALAAADKLKAAELRPNVVRSGPNYVVYIATADLLKLAEEDDAVRRAVALYLAEKAKNGTPRQREIAEKILQTLFKPWLAAPTKPIIAPTRRIKPPHATRDLRQKLHRRKMVDRPGFLGGFSPEPGISRVQGVCAAGPGPRGWASFR